MDRISDYRKVPLKEVDFLEFSNKAIKSFTDNGFNFREDLVYNCQGVENFCKSYRFRNYENSYRVLNDMTLTFKVTWDMIELLSNYSEGLSPIEDLYYSYENELKGTINDPSDLEALLVSGEFLPMMEQFESVPSWVINDIYSSYENFIEKDIITSKDNIDNKVNYLELEQYIMVSNNDFNKVIPYNVKFNGFIGYNHEEYKETIDDIIDKLLKNNIDIYMYTTVNASIPSIDEDYISIPTVNDVIEKCGNIHNFNYNYEIIAKKVRNAFNKN